MRRNRSIGRPIVTPELLLRRRSAIVKRVSKIGSGWTPISTVRRQGFWDNRLRELTEALVHQVCHIRLLHLDEASGAV